MLEWIHIVLLRTNMVVYTFNQIPTVYKRESLTQIHGHAHCTVYLQATEGRDETHSVWVTDTVSHGTGLLDVREQLCNNAHIGFTHDLWISQSLTYPVYSYLLNMDNFKLSISYPAPVPIWWQCPCLLNCPPPDTPPLSQSSTPPQDTDLHRTNTGLLCVYMDKSGYNNLNVWVVSFTGYGCMRFAPGVDVHEGACSHSDLDITNVKAAFSKHGCLLVRHLRQRDRGNHSYVVKTKTR